MSDSSINKAEERWSELSTSEIQANIVRGTVRMAMSMGLPPNVAGQALLEISDQAADGLAYGFSGVPNGETIRDLGRSLLGNHNKD